MNKVYGLWVYEKPDKEPILWSLHKTEDGAEKVLKLIASTGKSGFTGQLPVKD